MSRRRRFLSILTALCMLITLFPASAFAQSKSNDRFLMELKAVNVSSYMGTSKVSYLNTQGFSVFLNNTNFDRTFGDQKCAGMEMILHGERIATDGDIRLLPTPEQWDACPTSSSHGAIEADGALYNNGAFDDFGFTYTTKVTPEPGGFKVSVTLDKPLPERLVGRAGFNLEFLPAIYRNKTYSVDGETTGVIPATPSSSMVKMPVPSDDPLKRNPWQKQWDIDRGDYQPLPLVTGSSITLAPEDELHRVKISSENGALSLYDGRTKAQNGWFVLRTLIPAGQTGEVVTWHIRPNLIQDWTRDPVVTYSQVGYALNQLKTAVIELDPLYDAPQSAEIVRLDADGSYETVFEGPLAAEIPFTRYHYQSFDFTEVNTPGTYAIRYDGNLTDSFQIAENVYSNTWQDSLVCFLAEQMDHAKVRDGYLVRHGISHMDDARQAPAGLTLFDGWSMGASKNSPYADGEHIEGLNVGGFYDAGDFDIQTGSNISIIQDLVNAYKGFNLKYDNLTVDKASRDVEMHRPDGIPDALQLTKHGVLQILAQIDTVGHTFNVLEVPTLRQYTHLGDGATETDGKIYSSDPDLVASDPAKYSSIPDDRWAVTSANLDSSAYAALAASAWALKDWDKPLANKCLAYAQKIWNEQPHTGTSGRLSGEWNAAIYLMLATYGDATQAEAYEGYKARIKQLAPAMFTSANVASASLATFILPYMDNEFKEAYKTAAAAYVVSYDKSMASTPYGIATMAPGNMWGGSQGVCTTGVNMYFLHKAFPDTVSGKYTLRVANYILGMHPVNSTSWVAGVGKNSKTWTYSNNRAYETNIPGGIIPGYVVISPDFPECMDNFGMLWFEHETCTADVSKWVVAALAASSVAQGNSTVQTYPVNMTVTDGSKGIAGAEVTVYQISPDTNVVYTINPDTNVTELINSNAKSEEPTNSNAKGIYQVNPDTAVTNAYGEALFDLAAGNYSYKASKAGYDNASGTFTVSSESSSWKQTISLVRNSSQIVATPTASLPTGTYSGTQTVSLSTSTTDARIYYTTDGSMPSASSPLYTGEITISKDTTLKAIAVKDDYVDSDVATYTYTISSGSSHSGGGGGSSTLKASAPTASPDGGTYTSSQSVKLATSTAGASIYYTTDGSTPTSASTLYDGAIKVNKSMKLRAIAIKSGYTNSNVATFTYTINDTPDVSEPKAFSDISSHWAKSYIMAAVKAGYVSGYENGTFQPESYVTRAQFVKMIVVAFGFTGNGNTTFVDSTGHWALPQIETAAINDLVTGVTKPDGSYFLPDDKISREQVTTILYRAAAKRGITLPETSAAITFSDQSSISSYALPAVAAMQKAGTISGSVTNGNTVFSPQGYATRAEAVKMIQGLLELH